MHRRIVLLKLIVEVSIVVEKSHVLFISITTLNALVASLVVQLRKGAGRFSLNALLTSIDAKTF